MFVAGDKVRLVNWHNPPSTDTGTIIGSPESTFEFAYYVEWDDAVFNRKFRNCYWRLNLLEAWPMDPVEVERRADQKRREEHAMRYL